MTNQYALDSNILIYLHDTEPTSPKRSIAEDLITNNPVISPQTISEYLNVCHKKLKLSKEDALEALLSWLPFCTVAEFTSEIYPQALRLLKRYQFQMFDIVLRRHAASSID